MLQGAGNYRDKTVILSGAEHPLGRLLVRALAAEGATVVAIGRRARPLERLARRDPQRIEPLAIALDDRAMQRVLRDAWGDTPVHAAIDLSPLLEAPSLTLKHRLAAATGLIDALRAGLVAGAGCHVLAIPRPGKNREAMAARAAYATVVAHMRAGLAPARAFGVELSAVQGDYTEAVCIACGDLVLAFGHPLLRGLAGGTILRCRGDATQRRDVARQAERMD